MKASLLDTPRKQPKRTVLFACALALLAHVAAAGAATTVQRGVDEHPAKHPVLLSEMIELEEPPPPPPPPPPAVPEPEPPPPPPKVSAKPPPEPTPVPPPAAPPPAAAPAAAQAAQVLTQEPKDEVLDFGETIVQGDSAAYAGGVTEAGGTSSKAVRDARARAGGIEGGTGTDTSGVDRSRAASLAGGAFWDCPFPEEADDEGIDQAVVTLRVRVALDGTLEDVRVASDPGSGFGREARRCARDKRWQPARDRAGNAIASESAISVRFSR
jgi:protein TonB